MTTVGVRQLLACAAGVLSIVALGALIFTVPAVPILAIGVFLLAIAVLVI